MTDTIDIPMHLPAGVCVRLLQPPNLAEFALPGNARQFTQLMALFDGTTQTGAMYYYATETWQMQQPVERELFWAHCQLMDSLMPSQDVAAALAGTMPANTTKH